MKVVARLKESRPVPDRTVVVNTQCRHCGRPMDLRADPDCPRWMARALACLVRCEHCLAEASPDRRASWWTRIARAVVAVLKGKVKNESSH